MNLQGDGLPVSRLRFLSFSSIAVTRTFGPQQASRGSCLATREAFLQYIAAKPFV